MKIESFYLKYANVPIEKRFVSTELIQQNGYAHAHTLAQLYADINAVDIQRREAIQELEALLKIAERLMHSYPLKK